MEKDDVDVMDLDDAGPAIAPLPYPTEDTDGAEYDGFIQDVDDVKIVQCHYGGVLPELPTPTPPSTPFVSENQDDLFGTRVELPSLPEIEHRQHQGVGRPAPAKRVEETRRLGTSDEPPMGYFATIDSPANLAAAQGLRLDPATGHLFFGTNPKPLAKFEMRSPEHVRKEAEALARYGLSLASPIIALWTGWALIANRAPIISLLSTAGGKILRKWHVVVKRKAWCSCSPCGWMSRMRFRVSRSMSRKEPPRSWPQSRCRWSRFAIWSMLG